MFPEKTEYKADCYACGRYRHVEEVFYDHDTMARMCSDCAPEYLLLWRTMLNCYITSRRKEVEEAGEEKGNEN